MTMTRRDLLRGRRAPPESLDSPASRAPKTAAVQGNCIALAGVTCRLCEEACEPLAIRFKLGMNGKSYPLVDDEQCNGCGDCATRCPSQAIVMIAKPDGEVER